MGNPRTFFRPDHQPERDYWYRRIASSTGRQTIKREHARRQRQYDLTVVLAGLLDWEDGQWA